jgi:deazaflavin-dependent oxidoreductase (nitroreductase family)
MAVEITPDGTRGKPWPRGPIVRFLLGLNTALYRLLRGRGMRRWLLLTTIGARTGIERTVPLMFFPDGPDAWLVIGSAGGDARHPAWVRNLAANPERARVEVGGRTVAVRAVTLKGAEREEVWNRVTAKAPYFNGYQRSTDREIPLFRLTRS